MNWKTVFNPFLKFDEKTLLISGVISITLVFITGYFFGLKTDSLFHFTYFASEDTPAKIILSTVLVYAITILVFFGFGRIINRRTRLIDIVNPIFLSQFIIILLLLISEIPLIKNAQQQILASVESQSAEIGTLSLLMITIYSFLSLAITAYGITILFNGFKTATNMKDWRHTVIFILLLLTLMITMQLL